MPVSVTIHQLGRGASPKPVDESVGYEAAFKDLLAAIESKDVAAGVEALGNFVEMCKGEAEGEPDTED